MNPSDWNMSFDLSKLYHDIKDYELHGGTLPVIVEQPYQIDITVEKNDTLEQVLETRTLFGLARQALKERGFDTDNMTLVQVTELLIDLALNK